MSSIPCPQCGFDPARWADNDLNMALSDEALRWGRLLATTPVMALRIRPSNGVWAAMEYAAHVRDLLGVYAERIVNTRGEADPCPHRWDPEALVRERNSIDEDPVLMAEAISAGARKMQAALRGGDLESDRVFTGRPGQKLTLGNTVRFVLHEMQHHRRDVEEGVAQVDWPVPLTLGE